jgi:hypothetical protein
MPKRLLERVYGPSFILIMAFATVLSAKEDSVCTIPTAPDTLQDCTAESFLRHILK